MLDGIYNADAHKAGVLNPFKKGSLMTVAEADQYTNGRSAKPIEITFSLFVS